MSFASGPKLRPEAFRMIREVINAYCGLYFEDESGFVMERRLRPRLEALGIDRFDEYYRYLKLHPRGPEELGLAAEALTTHETYFLRERYQLDAFAQEVLPRIAAAAERSRCISVWSAGCSTGEEVYSIAMMIRDTGRYDDWDVRVFGTDISRPVLQSARRGVYGESSFRALPPRYFRYFTETAEGRVVKPEIRALCHFGQLNLLEHERSVVVGTVQAVFCRNVLIYFDNESRRRVLRTIYERLTPGGFLMLGHSESLIRASTDFELVHLSSDLVYRRPMLDRSADSDTDAAGRKDV